MVLIGAEHRRNTVNTRTIAVALTMSSLICTFPLSGFAKSRGEKVRAEQIARGVDGVTRVENAIIVR